MSLHRTARRSKSLTVEPIDGSSFRFLLTLDDTSHSEEGEELIHSLEIEGTLSVPELEILSIEPRAHFQPYPQCAASLEPVRELVGARIQSGFRKRVMDTMGRVRGCTHFLSLMQDLAAAHTLTVFLRMRERASYSTRSARGSEWMRAGLEIEPRLENACIALQSGAGVIEAARGEDQE